MPARVEVTRSSVITEEKIIANTNELAWARSVIGLPGKPNPKDVNKAYRVLEKFHV